MKADAASKAKPDKPTGSTPDILVAEPTSEMASIAVLPLGKLGADGDGSVPLQVTRLQDPRLRTAQRQQMAGQMGRLQGNRQLQRAVSRTVTPAVRPAQSIGKISGTTLADPPEPETDLWSEVSATDALAYVNDVPPPSQPIEVASGAVVQRGAWDSITGAVSNVVGAIANPKAAALKLISGFAKDIPGYHLLGLILGKDPISDQVVERTPTTIFQAVLGLVPGGNKLFDSLNESGAIDKAFAWLEEQWAQLGLSWEAIKGLFKQAWDVLDFSAVLTNPSGTWEKLKGIFIGPINRIKTFVVSIGQKIMEFVFEGVMAKMGGGAVVGILKQAGAAFSSIVKDPIGFLGNLINGIKQGFLNFASNIGTHIKKGLMTWLFGQMAATGIELPKSFDMKGILALVMQVLGMTWQNLKRQAAKVLGAGVVSKLESAFEIFQIVKEQGIGGLWEYIKDQIGNLKDMVLGGIKDLVITQVIQAGIKWLVSTLAGPAGAIVKAIETIYNVVMWVVNNAERLATLVSAVGNAISSIANGAVGVAANFIENALATAIPNVIGFLASLLGLGDFGGKIRGLIERVQEPVNKALGWVIGKAKAFGAKLWGKVKGMFRGRQTESEEVEDQHLTAGIMAGKAAVENLPKGQITEPSIRPVLAELRLRYKLGVLEPTIRDGFWAIHGEVQRSKVNTTVPAIDLQPQPSREAQLKHTYLLDKRHEKENEASRKNPSGQERNMRLIKYNQLYKEKNPSPYASLLNRKYSDPAIYSHIKTLTEQALASGQTPPEVILDMKEPTGWLVDKDLQGTEVKCISVRIDKQGGWHFFPTS